VQVGDGFWNIRGSFRVGGLLDVGTHASLVRLQSGDFVLLDTYTLSHEVERAVRALTDGGRAIRAILNLHPFHTLHVAPVASLFPAAKLYGTRRHKMKAPELSWEALETNEPALHALFADDLTFSVPSGVELIPENQNLHFASVLAFHAASRTLHVDDTLTWLDVPLLGGLRFHPTLRFVLEKRAGAASEFRSWAQALADQCVNVQHLCTAHGKDLPPQPLEEPSLAQRVLDALTQVESLLARHERRYG